MLHCGPREVKVPPAASLLEAFTTDKALEAVNLEHLDLLVDSHLEFALNLLLFATSPLATEEWQLTHIREIHLVKMIIAVKEH